MPPNLILILLLSATLAGAQTAAPSVPGVALGVPKPGPTNDAPYAPQPILQGGVVVPLYPPGSPFLKTARVREAEYYHMSKAVPGRISWITNIHNPSIEVHTVEGGLNTGAAIILAAGGGHNTLNVGTEGADFVPYFFNYGVNTVERGCGAAQPQHSRLQPRACNLSVLRLGCATAALRERCRPVAFRPRSPPHHGSTAA